MNWEPSRRSVLKATGVGVVAGAVAACTTNSFGAEPDSVAAGDLAAALRAVLPGDCVLVAGEAAFDAERAAYHRTLDHQPSVIVVPRHEQDVAQTVALAAQRTLPIAVQTTGHGIARSADGGLLINTRKLKAVRVDQDARTATVGGGVLSAELTAAAGAHGLAAAVGSAPDVGVTGYISGGGLPVIGRSVGFAADHVRRITLVDPEGRIRTVTPTTEPDLFWAVRGGKSNFGVITEIESDLFPIARLYGGTMTFAARVPEVLQAYRAFTRDLTDQMTSSLLLVNVPAESPAFPAELRGHTLARVRIAFLGPAVEGEQLVRPLRELAPIQDTVADMPYTDIATIYADPPGPIRIRERGGLLHALDDATLARILQVAGPGAPSAPLGLEIRHLAGALARTPVYPNAIGLRDAEFNLFVADMALDPAHDNAIESAHQQLFDTLAPSLTNQVLPNFLTDHDSTPDHVRRAYTAPDHIRLTTIKRRHDPDNLFRINHNVPPR